MFQVHESKWHDPQAEPESQFLEQLGQRVRTMRALRGMSQGARQGFGISERYIAQLESGKGNVSIVLLRRVAAAMGAPVEDMIPTAETGPDWLVIRDLMRSATAAGRPRQEILSGNGAARTALSPASR
jgi:XRE family aerobic/anaerobic benzoate catabolism transcriptional regulator